MTADVDRHEGRRLGPGEWWACEYPERRPEQYRTVYYPGRCAPCRIALQAAMRAGLPRLAPPPPLGLRVDLTQRRNGTVEHGHGRAD